MLKLPDLTLWYCSSTHLLPECADESMVIGCMVIFLGKQFPLFPTRKTLELQFALAKVG